MGRSDKARQWSDLGLIKGKQKQQTKKQPKREAAPASWLKEKWNNARAGGHINRLFADPWSLLFRENQKLASWVADGLGRWRCQTQETHLAHLMRNYMRVLKRIHLGTHKLVSIIFLTYTPSDLCGRGIGAKLILKWFSSGFRQSSNPSLLLKNPESLMEDVCKLFASENTEELANIFNENSVWFLKYITDHMLRTFMGNMATLPLLYEAIFSSVIRHIFLGFFAEKKKGRPQFLSR